MLNFEGKLRVCANSILFKYPTRFIVAPQPHTTRPLSESAKIVSNLLSAEINEKKSLYKVISNTNSILKETGFSLLEKKDCPLVKLVKNIGNRKITIEFESKEHFQGYDLIKNDDGSVTKNIKPMPLPLIEFFVIVNDEEGKGIIFSCGTDNKELMIFRIGYYKNTAKRLNSEYKKRELNEKVPYDGPIFVTLDDNIKDEFKKYLLNFGITPSLLQFIQNAAINKEEKLCLKWLILYIEKNKVKIKN